MMMMMMMSSKVKKLMPKAVRDFLVHMLIALDKMECSSPISNHFQEILMFYMTSSLDDIVGGRQCG